MINKTNLIERIAELVRSGRITEISDMRDESDRRGMSIVIELKRGATAKLVLNQIYKYTPLQSTFSINLLALVDGEPRHLSLKRALQVYIEHRRIVIQRRSQYELEKARQRAHVLEGLLIALANLDAVIQTIRNSPDADTAKSRLMTNFKLTEVQAQAILDMQLRRLAALERQKIEDEHKQLLDRIAALEDLLANPHKILEVIKDDLNKIAEKFGDERRTKIQMGAREELKEKDLIADESILITFTQRGYIKRTSASLYRTQIRGGRGVMGQTVREEDEVLILIPARTLHTVLFFSDRGKVYSEKAYQIPDANRTDKGIPIVNVLALDANERITAAVAVPDLNIPGYCTMGTVRGVVKRVALSDFASVRPSGLIAMNLGKDDELGWVRLTTGTDEVILVTAQGKALRILEKTVRSVSRQAGGVSGIRLKPGDKVASMEVVEPNADLFIATEKGFGKRTPLKEYAVKGRGSQGVTTLDDKYFGKTGRIASARVVQNEDEVTMISSNGVVLRLKASGISQSGRAARGTHIMDIGEGDTLASVARISAEVNKVVEETPQNGENKAA